METEFDKQTTGAGSAEVFDGRVVGGIDADGNARPFRVGADGGLLAGAGPVLVQDAGTVTAGGQGIVATPGLLVVGWAATENAGTPAAASFTLRRGISAAGARLLPAVRLAAGESASDEFPSDGVNAPEGVFVDALSGSVDLILYYRVVT